MQTENLTQAQTPVAKADKAQDFYFTPRTDVYETGDALVLVADVPGAAEQGIEVTFEGEQLTIEAKVEGATHEGFQVGLREYDVASYRRSFTVHTPIDRDSITAALADGVLRVSLPKAKEAKVQKIQSLAVLKAPAATCSYCQAQQSHVEAKARGCVIGRAPGFYF